MKIRTLKHRLHKPKQYYVLTYYKVPPDTEWKVFKKQFTISSEKSAIKKGVSYIYDFLASFDDPVKISFPIIQESKYED